MKKSFVDKNGKIEVIEIPDIVITLSVQYEQFIGSLIREKYTLDDELSLNSKSMQIFLNNCTDEQKVKWMGEIKDFTDYREQCIVKAKEICNLQ